MGVKKNPLKTPAYSIFYEQDSEVGFVAFAPAPPGCHTQGDSYQNPNAADRVVREIFDVIRALVPFPHQGFRRRDSPHGHYALS